MLRNVHIHVVMLLTTISVSIHGIAARSYPTSGFDPLDSFKLHANIAVSRIGVSPVPVPPFEYPSMSIFLSAKKSNLSYDPDFTFGLNAKPWMINNWIHYHFINKKKFQAAVGINPFLYFTDTTPKKPTIVANRGISAETFANYIFSAHWSVNIDYRYDHGFNNAILSGHFFCMSVATTQNIFSSWWLRLIGHAVYLNYPGHFSGLFAAGEIACGLKKVPISISLQSMQPVVCGTKVSFIWNAGIVLSL